jgi:hypothetical protein
MLKDSSVVLRNGRRLAVSPIDRYSATMTMISKQEKRSVGILRSFRSLEDHPEDLGRMLYIATFDKDAKLKYDERIEIRAKILRDSRWGRWSNFFTAIDNTWGVCGEFCEYTVRVTREQGIVTGFEYNLKYTPQNYSVWYRVDIESGLGDFTGDDARQRRKAKVLAEIKELMYVGDFNY